VLDTEQEPSNTPFINQWSLDEHKSALDNPDIGHWIVESASSQTPQGYVIATGLLHKIHDINLKRIVVSSRGKGIGRQALHEFNRKAFEELGAIRVWLVVHPENERAKSLYRSEGYKEVGFTRKKQNVVMALDCESDS
jgi:RimJ/RimL family protein N-acetyltransferase